MPLILLAVLILSVVIGVQAQETEVDVSPTQAPANTTLRARVFYENSGRPVRRMSVMLMGVEGVPRESSGLTDAYGNLTIKNLRAGKYFAVVNAPGAVSPLAYADFRQARNESILNSMLGFPAIVVDGITDIETNIPVKTGGSIGGRITYADGSPAIGVSVQILRKVGEEYLPTLPNLSVLGAMNSGSGMFQTDDRGVYRFPGLPAGEYIVKVTESVVHSTNDRGRAYNPESMLFGGSGSMLDVFFLDAFEKETAQKLVVALGQELSEINITIPDRSLHTLEGKLVAARDKLPIRNARISLIRPDETEAAEYSPMRNSQIAYTDNEGKWKFVDLPRGSYKISVSVSNSEFDPSAKAYGSYYHGDSAMNAANYATNAVANAMNGPSKPAAPKFSSKSIEYAIEDADLTEQIIELNHGARILGTISSEGGKGLPDDMTIIAADEDGDNSVSDRVNYYDYEGNPEPRPGWKEFAIEAVPAGLVYVTINVSNQEFYLKSAMTGDVDLISSPLNLKEAGVVANVKIVLANDTGLLECQIQNQEKQPVGGFELMFVPTDSVKFRNSSFYRSGKSGQDGMMKVRLPPLEYAAVWFPKNIGNKRRSDFYVWLADAVKKAPKFTIESGKTVKGSMTTESGK